MSYDNTNRWTLNRNDRKETDRHPDYKGSLNVDGVDYWIDGWVKDGANGKFISGTLKPKEARKDAYSHQDGSRECRPVEDDSDVPF